MNITEKMLRESMYLNSEAPFFDCSKFKSIVNGGKNRQGFFERINTWCDVFTASRKKEIYTELQMLRKQNGN
jgi:hypothetical protein